MSDLRGCIGKHRFGSEADAERRKNSIWFERRVALRVYACTECGGYHLTKRDAVAPVGHRFGPPKRPYADRQRYARDRRRQR